MQASTKDKTTKLQSTQTTLAQMSRSPSTLKATAEHIARLAVRRVALQFPDALLSHAPAAVAELLLQAKQPYTPCHNHLAG